MKIIKPEDFPIEMTSENICVLAKMSLMFPTSLCYKDVLPFLSFDDKVLVSNKVRDVRIEEEKARWDSLMPEEKEKEKKKLEESFKDTTSFKGNLLEQERHASDLEMKWLKDRETKSKE